MSNQLHRRLAYRTGGTGTDTTSGSFWDSSDFSTAHAVSHMDLFKRYMTYSGSGTAADPYRLYPADETSWIPGIGCPEALFLTGGTDPVIMFSATVVRAGSAGTRITLGNSFRAHDFIGTGERLAANPILGNVSKRCNQPMYASYSDPTFVSSLCTSCVTRDHSGVHWYFLQSSNATGNFYKNAGYTPFRLSSDSPGEPYHRQNPGGDGSGYNRVNIPTNYGIRILHYATPSGGYPLEAERTAMVASTKEPGSYTYYWGTNPNPATDNANVATMRAENNRQAWDFTLLALEARDFSPANYFTNNAPISMQCLDSGQKMAFLSAISTNGQALSLRTMTVPWDIQTLSTTTTERAMTDFQAEVCAAVGTSSDWIQWIWFKFSPDGKKLILVSHCGVVAKFLLTNAYDLATMALQTAVRLPAQPDLVSPPIMYRWSTRSISTYVGTDSDLRNPIRSADIDPDGQSLVVSVGEQASNNTGGIPPFANSIVQYRL